MTWFRFSKDPSGFLENGFQEQEGKWGAAVQVGAQLELLEWVMESEVAVTASMDKYFQFFMQEVGVSMGKRRHLFRKGSHGHVCVLMGTSTREGALGRQVTVPERLQDTV